MVVKLSILTLPDAIMGNLKIAKKRQSNYAMVLLFAIVSSHLFTIVEKIKQ